MPPYLACALALTATTTIKDGSSSHVVFALSLFCMTMSFRTIPQRLSHPEFNGSNANQLNMWLPTTHEYSNPRPNQPLENGPAVPAPCRFAPFDEHLNTLNTIPRWQTALDDHFTNIFRGSVLSRRAIDDMVAPALRILGRLTQTKVRALALTVYIQWIRMQFRSRNPNILAREIVGLISGIANHLGRMSVRVQVDFLDELGYLCIEKLKLTLRWYVNAVFCEVLPIPRQNLFMRVMAVVAMISRLFQGGLFRYSAALNSLHHVSALLPWPDAIAIVYALLHELGPRFALERDGWQFINCLLAKLTQLTVARVPADPVHQLVSAITTLVAGWYNSTFTLYHTYPGARN